MTAGPLAAPPKQRAARPPHLRRSNGWWTAAVIVTTVAVIPPISLTWQVISAGTVATVPFSRLAELLGSTILLTVAVTGTALVLGTATAWITARTSVHARRTWMTLAGLPLVIPSYVAALTIIGATGPAGVLDAWFGLSIPTPYGFAGAWFALAVFLAPMVHLILVPALKLIDPATEEAAIGLGASRRKVFATVTLPQLRPALISAGLMVSLYTVSDFGAVSLLRYDTFTRAIYTLYQGQIDRRPAASLSLVLMVLALLILMTERRIRSRAAYHRSRPRRVHKPVDLRPREEAAALGFLGFHAILSLGLPLIVLVHWLVRGLEAGQLPPSIWQETARSVGASTGAAIIAAAVALPVAMVTTRIRGRYSDAIETSIWGVYALPHIAVGVAVVAFALSTARPLYQTLGLLIVTYVIMFMAQSMSATQDSLLRASPDLEDASRGLGKGPLATLTRITIPIATPGLVAGAALVFLSVMKELPATLLLRPNGFETLAIRIWSATGEGFFTRASVATLVLLAVSVLPLLAVVKRDLSD